LKTGGIILAGGKGTRLGMQKAWAELGGCTLLQRAVSNLEFLGSEIIIVKAPGAGLPPVSSCVNLKVTEDTVSGKGPLAGILAGLSASNYRQNLVVACDMPLLNRELLKYIITASSGFQAAILRFGQQLEPLQAVYSKDCIPEIEKLMAADRLKVDYLFPAVRTRFIEVADIERFDPQHLSYMNINTRADLENASKFLS
jgi:molybdopterin-guanine dinucleotide biosynthesis protein A